MAQISCKLLVTLTDLVSKTVMEVKVMLTEKKEEKQLHNSNQIFATGHSLDRMIYASYIDQQRYGWRMVSESWVYLSSHLQRWCGINLKWSYISSQSAYKMHSSLNNVVLLSLISKCSKPIIWVVVIKTPSRNNSYFTLQLCLVHVKLPCSLQRQ